MIRLFVLTAILIGNIAYAGDDRHECQGGHNCNDTGTVVSVSSPSSVSNSVRDSSSSIGIGGSDVDIAQYYRSFGNALWLDTKVNKLALAAWQDSVGLHEAAAISRCSVRSVRKDYNDRDHCIRLNTVMVIMPLPEFLSEENDEDEEDEEERFDAFKEEYQQEQSMFFEDMQAKIRNLESDYQEVQQIQTIQQSQPVVIDDGGAERRARARAAGDAIRKQAEEE